MSKDKFFFEEDPSAAPDSGMTWDEHSDTFFSVLEEAGIAKTRDSLSLEPIEAKPQMQVQKKRTTLVEIEFGKVRNDYVIHITPIHPHKNLKNDRLLKYAVGEAVKLLNQYVPQNVSVAIWLPRDDYEIKSTSFVIKDGAEAWNLDIEKLENSAVPELLDQITQICMKA